MFHDDEDGCNRHEGQGQSSVAVFVEKQCEVRKGRDRGDGSERNITEENYEDEKYRCRQQNRFRSDHGECAQSGGDSFAAAKVEPERKHMADDGEKRGQGSAGGEVW